MVHGSPGSDEDLDPGMILIENTVAVERSTEYGVKWTASCGDELMNPCRDLDDAVRHAEKVNGCIVERVTYITGWEPYFGEPDSG